MEKRAIEEYKLEISVSVTINEEVYFIAFNAPALLKKNKIGEISIVLPFGINVKNLYTGIIAYKNKILLIPYHAQEFILYDISTGAILKRDIPDLAKQKNQDSFFDGAVLYEKYAVVVGCRYAGIAIIDMESFDIEIVDTWRKEYLLKRVSDYKTFFYTDVCLVKKSVFMLMSNAGYIMEYNLVDKKTVFHRLSDENTIWINICYDGNQFWIRGNDDRFVCWDNKTGNCKDYGYIDTEKKDKEVGYVRSWYQDQTVYFCDRLNSAMMKINLDGCRKCEFLKTERSEIVNRKLISELCLSPLYKGDVIYETPNFCVNIEDYINYIKKLD